jgi:hypothetical protein
MAKELGPWHYNSPSLVLRKHAVWQAGDSDIFGSGQPLKPVAGEIVAVLTADEEEEQRAPALFLPRAHLRQKQFPVVFPFRPAH